MKKNPVFFKYSIFTFFAILIIVSCEKDYSDINTSIKGVKNFDTKSKAFSVLSYTKALNPVQTNNLISNLIGVYNDQNFGTTTANVVTQLVPENESPDFGENPRVISVTMTIPYFSKIVKTDADGKNTYELDSLFGNLTDTYKLSIYKSNYLLRDIDPTSGFEIPQAYYANQMPDFEANLGELLYQNNSFTPNSKEIEIKSTDKEGKETIERIAPSLRVTFTEPSKDYWKELFLDNQDEPVLTNSTNFKNFFRGIVIKVEPTGGKTNMIMLNFASANANITVDYTNKEEEESEDDKLTNPTEYKLNFAKSNRTTQRLNTFNNNFIINDGDSKNGDDILYLKGMQGSMIVLDLFKDSIINEQNVKVSSLDYFKSKKDKWLLNEASLTLHVDKNTVQGKEPDRLFLFDLKNNIPIKDYFEDASSENINFSKITHSVPLYKDNSGKGTKYKLRLTRHITDILELDSTNTKLGIYIAGNINNRATSQILGKSDNDVVNKIPKSSILSPLSTFIHGSKLSVPEEKRLKFEVYYTEPKK